MNALSKNWLADVPEAALQLEHLRRAMERGAAQIDRMQIALNQMRTKQINRVRERARILIRIEDP
jgi:hypothetical protein